MVADARAQPRRILFLDVDGVLHPLRVEFRDGKVLDDHCFVASCCKELQRIVRETGAELVLSSSWRCYEAARAKLADALAPYGLHFKRWTTTADLDGVRMSQILDFLQGSDGKDVESWAVVDDEDVTGGREGLMAEVMRSRFVQTSSDKGITKSEADRIISILQDQGGSDSTE